ncbi:MAG: hypothetical protein IPJ71_17875 [Bdellovibrionales bacterium]|nr:hypothetical protein [Bdellovibrionales bacterium]
MIEFNLSGENVGGLIGAEQATESSKSPKLKPKKSAVKKISNKKEPSRKVELIQTVMVALFLKVKRLNR